MKSKGEAALHKLDTERLWWVGRCSRCHVVKMAVEVGDGDEYSRGAMESYGYEVKQEKGPIDFRPHAKECGL